MTEFTIGLSKRKLFFAFIGSTIFLILGIQFIFEPEKYISSVFRNTEFIRIAGFASFIFSGLCLIYIVFKAFDKKPGLIVNQNGITDNSNFSSVGLIKWSEIIGIRTQQVMSTKFLLIDVSNPKDFIQKSSSFKAWLMKANLKMYHTPLSITSNSLKYNFDDLEKLVHQEWSKYKNS
ncbi:STM3941 family protein [Flavobacterium sp. 245]|uniref:STM3941 family protein n=1 Tax=Flavobacterium sp. 245 TaxID=2512115 RepID=UPI0010618D36|nr:STM3941 family protein [Flavobacterium sp. 245]TDO97732.1 hypothetical protein EV145_10991 [Flavobacterium sp. 245]